MKTSDQKQHYENLLPKLYQAQLSSINRLNEGERVGGILDLVNSMIQHAERRLDKVNSFYYDELFNKFKKIDSSLKQTCQEVVQELKDEIELAE